MGLARRSRAASDGVPSTVVMHCPHKVAAGGRRCADPRRDSLRQVSYRVVPVFAWTVATLSLVTKPGPVMTGRPPPGMRPYSLYRVRNTIGRYPWRYCCWSIANSMVPAAIASRTSFERSKVPTLIVVLPICFRAAIVGEEPVGPRAMTVSIVGSAVRAAAIFCCVETGVADLLVDADRVLAAGRRHAHAGRLARDRLILPDVGQDAELRVRVGTGVRGDHRDTRGDALRDARAARRRVRERDHEAGRRLRAGGVNELAHLHHVEGVGGAVVDLDPHVL